MKIWRVPYAKFGDGPGLQRVAAIATRLDLDLAAFGRRGAVVVGSNGKGSTAAMCAALVAQVAAPVGLFTSPHLFALNERFRIDDEDIEDEALEHHWRRVAAAADAARLASSLGGFEFLFLIAADWFAARGCTHTIWEAGIGGRLDPVRLIAAKRLALTSLDLEHTQLLGESLEEIACDKIDAAPQGATLFVGASCAAQRATIVGHAASRGVSVEYTDFVEPPEVLPGTFQGENAALALSLARDMVSLNEAQARAGLRGVRWPGRLEVLQTSPLVVIDAGHTPRAVAAALDGFLRLSDGRRAVLIAGVSQDKDAAQLVATLAPRFEAIVCASAQHKGAPAAHIAAHAQAAHPGVEIVLSESVADARKLALAKAGADGAVYVAGGLFLAAEFRAAHLGRDPGALAFF